MDQWKVRNQGRKPERDFARGFGSGANREMLAKGYRFSDRK